MTLFKCYGHLQFKQLAIIVTFVRTEKVVMNFPSLKDTKAKYLFSKEEREMEQFPGHAIRKINTDEYALLLYLEDYFTEFAGLGSEPRVNNDLLSTAKRIIKERYNGAKVSVVKVIIGGIAVSSIPLLG